MSTFHNLHFVQGNNEYDYYPQVDNTLSVEGQAADAKVVGDEIERVKSDLFHETQLLRNATFINPNKNLMQIETVIDSDLYNNHGSLSQSAIYRSVYLPIDPDVNEYVCVKKIAGKILRIYFTASEPDVGTSIINGFENNTGDILPVKIPNTAQYLGIVYWRSDKDTITRAEMKSSLDVFYGQVDNTISIVSETNKTVERLNGYFVHHKSDNLFDNNDTVDKKYMDRSGTPTAANNYFYSFVKLTGAGIYKFLGASTLFGTSKVLNVPYYTADKTYVNYLTGSHFGEGTGNQYGVSFEITDAIIQSGVEYVCITQALTNKDITMVVKGDYPETYIPYYDYYQLTDVVIENISNAKLNPLYMKQALFFGDSICAGTSANDDKSGYAGRIGTANDMDWHNYGTNGATITSITGHHNISGDVVTAGITYPDADFIVLEGGTNDADKLGSERLGTFTETDYSGSYDTTTFSGAFETMLYNAIQQWPHAQIGYIAGHKMGNGANLAMRKTFFERAMELCVKWGIPYIDLSTQTKLNRSLSAQYDSSMTGAENIAAGHLYTDGQHLTPDGYNLITPVIEWWMCGI